MKKLNSFDENRTNAKNLSNHSFCRDAQEKDFKISNNREKKHEKKTKNQSEKISLRLLNELYKNLKCSFKHSKQKRRQKTKHLIDDSTFLCLQ